MQRDTPVKQFAAVKSTLVSQKVEVQDGHESKPGAGTTIQEAEIVFSSNRFYGHVTTQKDSEFVEIRGYKWDDAIAGEYYTEILKPDGTWGGGPTITITLDGQVNLDGIQVSDRLLKDNIASISEVKVPGKEPIQQCLVAVQDKLLNGWLQRKEGSPKIQIRGSQWKEGPGAHGSYICSEKLGDKWVSSNKSVIVTPSNKVRISELALEGKMDGLSAKLEPVLTGSTSSLLSAADTLAKLRFEGDTFTGAIITAKEGDTETEIAGFKYETVPGVYLLESRPLNSNASWTGLNLQLVVSENSRISISGNAVYNLGTKDDALHFDSDTILKQIKTLLFSEKSVLGTALQTGDDAAEQEVEIRGSAWYPKIAGTYETEIFTDSGWKSSKRLEITPQGEVTFGGEPALGVSLDSDTITFESVDGQLKDFEQATLAFDHDGFSGNVVTAKDRKSRVMRGKRIGTRPVSAHSGTELSLGNDEEDNFNDLNGQIGSTIKRKSAGKKGGGGDHHGPDPAGPGVTSDYGSASDVITQQMSGSRTEALSSLEEDISLRSKSPDPSQTSDLARNMNRRRSSEKTNISKSPREWTENKGSPRNGGDDLNRSLNGSQGSGKDDRRSSDGNVDLGDISLDVDGDGSGDAGISFEDWPPKTADGSKLDLDPESEADKGVKIDILPKGVSNLGKTTTKDPVEVSPQPLSTPTEASSESFKKSKPPKNKALKAKPGGMKVKPGKAEEPARTDEAQKQQQQQQPGVKSKPDLSGEDSPGGGGAGGSDHTEQAGTASPDDVISGATGATKLPSILQTGSDKSEDEIPVKTVRSPTGPMRSLDAPALTKPVKLPGIDMKTKGGAAEITDDAGLLENYMGSKGKKEKKKGKPKKPKKTKARNELRPDLDRKEPDGDGSDKKQSPSGSSGESSPVDINERARQAIEQAQNRRTPTARTPVHMAKIDRDRERDSDVSTPLSSGYTTPNSGHITPGSNHSLPQREFQGALMAAKKIKETASDHQLDGKIPSDIREHPVAEEVAEKFGMEMQVRDNDSNKLSVKERRELARQKKKEDAERKRREREEEKRRAKEEEEKRAAEEEAMKQRRAEREAELAAERQRELERRKEEESRRRAAKMEEREKKKRDEEKMLDAKRKLEEELRRRRAAEAARLEEIERQKALELAREKEEQEKRKAEAEALRAQMEEEMARDMAEYERKMKEEQERLRIEEALKAEAERRLLDEEERRRIIALARHLWNKGVRIEGQYLEQELEISSIFYSYFNYLQSEEPYNPDIDITYKEKLLKLETAIKTKSLDKI